MQTNNCIKVLNINYDSNPYGGVTMFLMNVYRHIDHKIQFDFLTADKSSYYLHKQEIKNRGGEIYAFHIDSNSPFGKLRFGKKLFTFLKDHPYDIVHVNSGVVSFECISAVVAKSRGTKVVIHSHNTGGRCLWKAPVAYLMKLIMQKAADGLCACSDVAARNTFTSAKVDQGDVLIIKNGIDLQKFQYDEGTRNKVRHEMNLKGRFVVGHVGRFSEQKNHEFLIDIFAEILSREPTAVLLLIGDGELEPVIREKVQKLQIQDSVMFLGNRDDVENLYMAMDVLLFPSLFEGLPLTLIEAQAAGLQCCISDKISTEVDITSLIHRIPLNVPAEEWAQTVLALSDTCNQRRSYNQELLNAGYEINNTAKSITNMYENLMKS